MTTTIIIIAYVANVFLNRWLNKIMNKYWKLSISPSAWFLGPICTAVQIVAVISEVLSFEERSNWFTGKHWK